MGFQFKDNVIHLDITGNKFDVNYTTELIKNSQDFKEKVSLKAKELDESKSKKEYGRIIDESIEIMKDAINLVCGEGATDKIFEGRATNFYDYVDVLNYIQEEILNYQQRNGDRFKKYSVNRVQRRQNEHANRSTSNKRKSR